MRSRARALVVELLRTLDTAQTDGSLARGDGGGVVQMPALYSHGSYQELERQLCNMRDGDYRSEWWHLSMRYRWGAEKREPLPTVKTRQGRKPLLPPRCEVRITGETLSATTGKVLMVVQYYTWDDRVNEHKVSTGIDVLTALMYGGQTWRLQLPKPFLERLEGHGVQPHTGYLPSHALAAT